MRVIRFGVFDGFSLSRGSPFENHESPDALHLLLLGGANRRSVDQTGKTLFWDSHRM
jgi:hypothetical protein